MFVVEPLKRCGNAKNTSHRTAWDVDRQLGLQRAVQDAPAADDVRAAVVCALLLAAALACQHGVVAAARIAAHREHRAQRGRLARIERQDGANLPGTSQHSGRRGVSEEQRTCRFWRSAMVQKGPICPFLLQ
jgi:hypothetical protein